MNLNAQLINLLEEKVVLVDIYDRQIGVIEKLQAHRQGLLHRAFSIFVLNSQGQLLLQKRAIHKYHSGGLWTNTCCSHPRPDELTDLAVHRRLQEEMGFDCEIHKIFDFIYKAKLDQGLTEHEFDHVFAGTFNANPKINHAEVESWKWMHLDDIAADMELDPEKYTVWFKIAFERVRGYLRKG